VSAIDLQNRSPQVERLPDLRLRVTRIYDVLNNVPKTPAALLASVWQPWGTADLEYPTCRLIKQDVSGQVGPFEAPCKEPPILTQVYEQISPTGETMVGNAAINIGPQYGLTEIVVEFLQFSGQTPIYGVPGVTTAPAPWAAYLLKTDERTDDGTLQRIKRTYTSTGVISTDVEYLRSVDAGTTGVTKTTIKYLSGMAVTSNPITPPGGSATLQSSFEKADGFKIWTGVYATGAGTVESSIEYRNNNLLIIYSITALNTPPSTPSATIGGTVTLIKKSQRNSPRLEEGAIVYDYVWVEGNGLIESTLNVRNDGLQEQTYVSLGTRQVPTGIIVLDSVVEEDGVPKYTVKCMQSYVGATPVGSSYTTYRNVPFTYPGVAEPYVKGYNPSYVSLDIFMSPPVEASIPGTVTISYQTTAAIGTIPTRWMPIQWAVLEMLQVAAIGPSGLPITQIKSLRGYRPGSGSNIAYTSPSGAVVVTCMGNPVQPSTVVLLSIYGGPPAPDGNTYTLDASTEIAFQDTAGNIYYRQTVISATIPTQPALPV
jgi:hypothetical protein